MLSRCFAVIHVVDSEQATRNARVAHECGLDGVFVISHNGRSCVELAKIALQCLVWHPWVGVNFLDLMADRAVQEAALLKGLSAVWVDQTFKRFLPDALEVFSGFAFKGQPQPLDLVKEAQEAAPFCDVLTTSGPGTGRSAKVDKVRAIREAIGPHKRLALASGVTPENVKDYLPYCTDFLVATGINIPHTDEIDGDRAKRLVEAVKGVAGKAPTSFGPDGVRSPHA